MSFILGMDTGGTYTDAVIIDAKDREVLCKAKALTTKDDLTESRTVWNSWILTGWRKSH